jgi:hypothetical protein
MVNFAPTQPQQIWNGLSAGAIRAHRSVSSHRSDLTLRCRCFQSPGPVATEIGSWSISHATQSPFGVATEIHVAGLSGIME